jgi:hypothetical protein
MAGKIPPKSPNAQASAMAIMTSEGVTLSE